jgi:transmembrane sensor
VEWQAAQWVARRMSDEPFDEPGFDLWLAGDPARRPVFDAMWRRFTGPGMDEALGAVVRQRRSRRALVAGSLVGVVVLFGCYTALPTLELAVAQPQEYAAADDSIRDVRLADGTSLTLAAGADVRVRYTSRARMVELMRGTIFADVHHDATRPFHIDAGNARIADLGTRFEVSKKPSDVRVTVESGAVRFRDNSWFGTQIDLTANQAAMLGTAGLSRTSDIGEGGVARWRSEWVEYRDAPLRQVVADLESVSPLPIRIADRKLEELRVSGRIRLVDPVRQIDNLSVIHDFAVDRQDGAIVLSNKVPR